MQWIAPSEKDTGTETLESRLWAAADEFRANSGLTSAQYSQPVLGLIFLRFAEVRFLARRAVLKKQATRGRRGSRVDDPTAYQAEGILYLPPSARFDHIVRLPEGSDVGRMDPDTLRGAVIDRGEHGDLAVAHGDGGGRIGAPHDVRLLSEDGAEVRLLDDGLRLARGRQEPGRPHDPEHAALRRAHVFQRAEPAPDLPVPFAVERTLGNDGANLLEQRGLVEYRGAATPPGRGGLVSLRPPRIERGPRQVPDPDHARKRVPAVPWRAKTADSSLRPPPAQRAAGLQMANLLDEQRFVRGKVRHDALQAPRVFVLHGYLAMPQAGLPASQELVTPLRELRGRHPVAATQALQRLALAAAQ